MNSAARPRSPHPVDQESTFFVEIERFQGPLDLLMHLIRRQDIDIFDIPIAKITDQFLIAVREIRASELDSAGEFLEMAASLVRIKAQMLLPRPSDAEDEDPRAELVRRLLEYEQIREITARLERSEAERGRRRAKGSVVQRERTADHDLPLETTWAELLGAALAITPPEVIDTDHRVTPRTVSMAEKESLILDRLSDGSRVEFRGFLTSFTDPMHGVMTFLAGLELTRRRRIGMQQARPFRDLWFYLRDDAPPVDPEDTLADPRGLPGAGPLSDPSPHPHEDPA